MYLGFDQNNTLVYEGITPATARGLWPTPFFSQATLSKQYVKQDDVPRNQLATDFDLIFREDFFDPVTRIRRGRFYVKSLEHSKPAPWTTTLHPTIPRSANSPYGYDRLYLTTFKSLSLATGGAPIEFRFVALGDRESYSVWKIISAERLHTHEFLVTLKSTSTADILPELDETKLDSESYDSLNSFLSKVVDTVHVAGPENIVDRCRDAASALLAWKNRELGSHKIGDDLNDQLQKYESVTQSSSLLSHSGHVIRLLHSRAKPNIKEKHSTPPLSESDIAAAMSSLATIMRDLRISKVE